jgi:hypothetical protein
MLSQKANDSRFVKGNDIHMQNETTHAQPKV